MQLIVQIEMSLEDQVTLTERASEMGRRSEGYVASISLFICATKIETPAHPMLRIVPLIFPTLRVRVPPSVQPQTHHTSPPTAFET